MISSMVLSSDDVTSGNTAENTGRLCGSFPRATVRSAELPRPPPAEGEAAPVDGLFPKGEPTADGGGAAHLC